MMVFLLHVAVFFGQAGIFWEISTEVLHFFLTFLPFQKKNTKSDNSNLKGKLFLYLNFLINLVVLGLFAMLRKYMNLLHRYTFHARWFFYFTLTKDMEGWNIQTGQ